MCGVRPILYVSSLITITIAWPDGAPCIHAVFESMNPLEAVEHQGGLQLSVPPYQILVREQCYWLNQPIELSLKGNTTADRFRGFVIQPISYKGPNRGRRIGQFLRLDDNGSWQQQCFRFKDSVTHSHDEKKKNIKLWWKNEDSDDDYVQFVATVVKAQKEFWVKAVKSVPIPPCRYERNGIHDYVPDGVTPPPPVKQFKLDTFRLFDAVDDVLQRNLLEVIPNDADRTPKPQRIQDFFKFMHISDRRQTKVPLPTTQTTRALAVAPSTQTPWQSQTAPVLVARLPPVPQQPNPARPIPTITAATLSPQGVSPFPVQQIRLQQQSGVASVNGPTTQPLPQSVPVPTRKLVNAPLVTNQVPQIIKSTNEHQQPPNVIPVSSPGIGEVSQRPIVLESSADHFQPRPIVLESSADHFQPRPIILESSADHFQPNRNQAGIIASPQQQLQRSEFRALPQAPNIRHRIFVRPIRPQLSFQTVNSCTDIDSYELCLSRITLCNTHEFMRLNCRRTCRFC